MKSRWSISALGAFFVAVAVFVAGCGSSGVPSGSVATVAGNPISKRAYDHRLYLFFKEQQAEDPTAPLIVPNDPPSFNGCVKQVRSVLGAEVKKDSDAKIATECKAEFDQYSPQVLDLLIKGYWYQAYAHKLGIKVTQAQVTKQLDKEKKTAKLSKPAAYEAFLKQNGYTNADLLWQTRVALVEQKLGKRYDTKVTSADIAAYYKSHASMFGSPQTRTLRIVLTKTSATAKVALAALKRGQSWKTVAKQYSTDPTTKNNGGLLSNVTKGQQDAALSKAAFAAPVGKLEGPVKGQFGYYVLEVLKVTPATHESLKKATSQIRETLTSQKQTAAQNALNKKVKSLYGSRTLCKAAYSMDDCHGYKKPATTTSASTAPATTPSTSATSTVSTSTTTSSSSSARSATTTTSSSSSAKKKK